MELLIGNRFVEVGTSQFGVLGGVRNIAHEWIIHLRDPDFSAVSVLDIDEDWTDLVVGATRTVPIAGRSLWSNRADVGFGDPEEAFNAATSVQWVPVPRWSFNANISHTKLERGVTASC